jgi:hypothetical protein
VAVVTDGRSLETLTAEDFRGAQGTRFRLAGGPGNGAPAAVDVELVDVTEHAARPAGTFRTPFSLLFHGPAEPVWPQGTYRLEHEHLDALELFVVPVEPSGAPGAGRARAVTCYEVVFG